MYINILDTKIVTWAIQTVSCRIYLFVICLRARLSVCGVHSFTIISNHCIQVYDIKNCQIKTLLKNWSILCIHYNLKRCNILILFGKIIHECHICIWYNVAIDQKYIYTKNKNMNLNSYNSMRSFVVNIRLMSKDSYMESYIIIITYIYSAIFLVFINS